MATHFLIFRNNSIVKGQMCSFDVTEVKDDAFFDIFVFIMYVHENVKNESERKIAPANHFLMTKTYILYIAFNSVNVSVPGSALGECTSGDTVTSYRTQRKTYSGNFWLKICYHSDKILNIQLSREKS